MLHFQISSCTRLKARNVPLFRRCYSSIRNPLRVLFCGSDEFSISSLRALHNLQKSTNDASAFASIDVICRPGKRTGRGLKKICELPIKSVAEELLLPLHQIDTFTDWNPPPYNLIVAVSFGLLVPLRIIHGAEHGGINVHPSLLPDLRGPAPLQHALLAGDKYTGVTIQTLSGNGFDKGQVLVQTPHPGVEIPECCSYSGLLELVQPLAAEMLCKYIYNTYLDSEDHHKETVPSANALQSHSTLRRAPKITPADREIDWENWTAKDMVLRERVLRRLWTTIKPRDGKKVRRVILEDFELLPDFDTVNKSTSTKPSVDPGMKQRNLSATAVDQSPSEHYCGYTIDGLPLQTYVDGDSLIIVTKPDNQAVRIKNATIEGYRKNPASSICSLGTKN